MRPGSCRRGSAASHGCSVRRRDEGGASQHYIARLPAIPAFDGIGALPDGTLVGFGNPRQPYGALAERTVVPKGAYVPIPEGLDPAIATVLGSAITGMSMKTAAGFVPGETVLVQGATGVAGRLAVKVARLLGAGRVVATGRDDDQLREVGACCVRWSRRRSRSRSRPDWSKSESPPAPASWSLPKACARPASRSAARPKDSAQRRCRRCTARW
ncbi:hypothetical protein [Asanoa hainanensis]|uniref:hypothetical protein n=1 Tax=Asanoa hainanensis TaxID=560556 RepID=UPI001C531764|nr:hypothetical protein [Asanoa hainanensis]